MNAPAPIELVHSGASSSLDLVAIAHEADTWIAVAFLIFLGLFCRYVLPLINRSLDNRATQIRDQLEQASRLRAEAEALLATYESQRAVKLQEGEEIIASAHHEAAELRARAATDLKAALERRSQQAVEKIARAEQDAIADIRARMIDIATSAVEEIIRTQLASGSQEDPAIARALQAIERNIH